VCWSGVNKKNKNKNTTVSQLNPVYVLITYYQIYVLYNTMLPCTRVLSRPLSSVHTVFSLSLPVCRTTVCASSCISKDISRSQMQLKVSIAYQRHFLNRDVSMLNYKQHHEIIRKGRWRIHECHILWTVHRDIFA
jgi:hypothetical protein